MNTCNILSVLTILCTSACLVNSKNENGFPAEPTYVETSISDVKHLVALYNKESNRRTQQTQNVYICPGALISLNHVVTSAKCLLENKNKEKVYLVAGITKFDGSEDGQERQSTNWSTKKETNIGIVKVDRAFVAGPKVATIPICNGNLNMHDKMRTSGWIKVAAAKYMLHTYEAPIRPDGMQLLIKRVHPVDMEERYGALGVINGQLCGVYSKWQFIYPKTCSIYANLKNDNVRCEFDALRQETDRKK